MSRTITYSDGHGPTGGFYTTIELDSGERVFVQIVKEHDRVFVKISKMRLGGLLPGKTLFEDSQIMIDFALRGPQNLSPDDRSREFLRRLSALVLTCGSSAKLVERLAHLSGEGPLIASSRLALLGY